MQSHSTLPPNMSKEDWGLKADARRFLLYFISHIGPTRCTGHTPSYPVSFDRALLRQEDEAYNRQGAK